MEQIKNIIKKLHVDVNGHLNDNAPHNTEYHLELDEDTFIMYLKVMTDSNTQEPDSAGHPDKSIILTEITPGELFEMEDKDPELIATHLKQKVFQNIGLEKIDVEDITW